MSGVGVGAVPREDRSQARRSSVTATLANLLKVIGVLTYGTNISEVFTVTLYSDPCQLLLLNISVANLKDRKSELVVSVRERPVQCMWSQSTTKSEAREQSQGE